MTMTLFLIRKLKEPTNKEAEATMVSPPSDSSNYITKLHKTLVKQAVDDLAREKLNGNKGRHKGNSYTPKPHALVSFGVVLVTRGTMYQKISTEMKKLKKETNADPPSSVGVSAASNAMLSLLLPSSFSGN